MERRMSSICALRRCARADVWVSYLACARVCTCATMCACMHVLAVDMCWRTQACECECRTSAVLYRHRCSANYATIAELLSPVRFRLSVDDLQPAPAYTPDNTSHAIRNRSPSTRAQRISTCAIEATQESARYRSAADHRRQRIFAGSAYVGRQGFFLT